GLVVDGRAALRAEVERSRLALVGDAYIFGRAALDQHPVDRKARLHAERTPGPALAGEAVAHRDPHRLSVRLEPDLATRTRRPPSGHACTVKEGAGAPVA